MSKRESRTARWNRAAAAALAALEELEAVCDVDLEGALATVQDAEGADLPLGFGRD